MHISPPTITEEGNLARYEVTVSSKYLTHTTLFYELDKVYSDMISDTLDAVLAGLLLPAMLYGEDMYLEGEISEKLYFNLSYRFQKLLQTLFPSLNIINIFPKDLRSDIIDTHRKECITGFSGGIDSFTTLADHFYTLKYPKSFKVTMLTFNNVGSHGSGEAGHALFLQRYNRLKHAAEQLGLPFVKINSNLDDFYDPKKLSFTQNAPIRNVSVALLLQHGVKRLLHSSSAPYKDLTFSPTQSFSLAEPIIMQMLSTENIELDSVGSEYSRVEKIKIVASIKDSYTYLDVCMRDSKDKTNCSACAKCLGTLLTLELQGNIHLYRSVFDLSIYQKYRSKILGEIRTRHYASAKAIYTLVKEKNLSFPLASYLYYLYYKLRYLIRKK